MIRREIQLFFTALMFYTRIPCPKNIDHSEGMLNKATRYFPLMGWIVGGFTALVFWSLSFVVPPALALLFSMIASILVTGAFHEDGFADVCDGFGGGYSREQILHIMKDSRIGTYGTIGLILILGTKFMLLNAIHAAQIPFLLIAGHSLSRFAPTLTIYFFNYARDDATSKVKPIGKQLSLSELFVAGSFALLPLLLFRDPLYLMLLLPVIVIFFYFSWYFNRKLGGYTGDGLGTIQQLTEVGVYLTYLLLLSF